MYLDSNMSKVGLMRLRLASTWLVFHLPTSGLLGLMNLVGDPSHACVCPPSVGFLMVIFNVSLPLGCLPITMALSKTLSLSLLFLGSPIMTLFLLADPATSGRISTFFPSNPRVFIGNGCLSICISAKLNHPSLIADCICHRKTSQSLVA